MLNRRIVYFLKTKLFIFGKILTYILKLKRFKFELDPLNIKDFMTQNLTSFLTYAVVPLADFLKIGSSAEIGEVGIEIIIKK